MVDVAPPSLAFVALCAFTTEEDLHYLRRLGRSCARCAELFWARDGRSRHRALRLDVASGVRSLDDDTATFIVDSTESRPLGLLAFIDIIDDALDCGNLPFGDLLLLARRTMQDDRHVLLYLLTFAVVTDRTLLVEKIVMMGEDWHAGVPLADSPTLANGKPAAAVAASNDTIGRSEDDAEMASTMRFAVANCRDASEPAEVSSESYETDDESSAASETEEGAEPSASVAQPSHVASSNDDFFSAWWPALGTHNTHVLRKYFAYLYPARTNLVFDDREALDQMTLAERLVAIATIYLSHNVAQLLWSTSVFRCNTSMAVLFACCNKLHATLHKAAEELAAVDEVDRRVLLPAGVARLKRALEKQCPTLTHHFRQLGIDAAFCDAMARFVDPKQRPLLDDDDLSLIKNYVRMENNADDDGEPEEQAARSAEPPVDFDVSASVSDAVDHLHVFWFACRTDRLALATEIVEKHIVQVNANENYALRLAAQHNSAEVLKWLLTRNDVDPAASDNAALCAAVDSGAQRTSALLIADKRVDVAAHNNYSLCRATERGDAAVVQALLASGRIDISARGCVPLLNALRNGMFDAAFDIVTNQRFNIEALRGSIGALRDVHDKLQASMLKPDVPPPARVWQCADYAAHLIRVIDEGVPLTKPVAEEIATN